MEHLLVNGLLKKLSQFFLLVRGCCEIAKYVNKSRQNAVIWIAKNTTNSQLQALINSAKPGDSVAFERGGVWAFVAGLDKTAFYLIGGTAGKPIA
jgi:hypothetical protein